MHRTTSTLPTPQARPQLRIAACLRASMHLKIINSAIWGQSLARHWRHSARRCGTGSGRPHQAENQPTPTRLTDHPSCEIILGSSSQLLPRSRPGLPSMCGSFPTMHMPTASLCVSTMCAAVQTPLAVPPPSTTETTHGPLQRPSGLSQHRRSTRSSCKQPSTTETTHSPLQRPRGVSQHRRSTRSSCKQPSTAFVACSLPRLRCSAQATLCCCPALGLCCSPAPTQRAGQGS